jgi:gliding motility-associated-like protein
MNHNILITVKNNVFFLTLFFILVSVNVMEAHHEPQMKNLQFVENKGQWNAGIHFKTQLYSGAVFAEKQSITYVFLNEKQLEKFYEQKFHSSSFPLSNIEAAAYKVHFKNANEQLTTKGESPFPYYNNYYIGNDPEHWASEVSIYANVLYENLYDGITMKLTQEFQQFKYEFYIAPYTPSSKIKMEYEGIEKLSIKNGELYIKTAVGVIREKKPYAYQIDNKGNKKVVECEYKVNKSEVGFELGKYDESLVLVIDPVLIFSTYSGSTADNWGYTATYDGEGNTYGGGVAFSIGYPTTLGAYQINYAGGSTDIAISKFTENGTNLLYSTYLGGSSSEVPNSLVVNEQGELYVLATTGSSNYPTTSGAISRNFSGGTFYTLTSAINFLDGTDIAVSKFNASGSLLLASTYIGGTKNDGLNTASQLKYNYADEVRGEIMIDNNSNVCIISSTYSTDFPITSGCFQSQLAGGQDACMIKCNHNLTNLIWASYLGGNANDAGYSLSIANDNSWFVCGGTLSDNLPTTANAYQSTISQDLNGLKPDGYIAHIHEFGYQLLACTYLGSIAYDQTYLIKTDRNSFPYVFGQTEVKGNFWIHNATWNMPNGGQFLSKLTPSLEHIVWSTAFGSGGNKPDISPTALMVDVCNSIYMSGWGGNTNGFGGTAALPVTSDALQSITDGNDFYLIVIGDDASSLQYATFFGSYQAGHGDHVDGGTSRFDKKGTIYQAVCGGCGGSNSFPTTPGSWSQTNGSNNCNLALFKIDFALPIVVSDFDLPSTACSPLNYLFTNRSRIYTHTSFYWDFGDGSTSTEMDPSHLFDQPGIFTVTLIVSDTNSCNLADTLQKTIYVLGNQSIFLPTIRVCTGEPVQIGIAPANDESITFEWFPTSGLNNPHISNPVATPLQSTLYRLIISNQMCTDTLFQNVIADEIDIEEPPASVICVGDSILLSINNPYPEGIISFYWSLNPSFSNILNTNTNQSELIVHPTQTTTYYLKMLHQMGCVKICSVVVTVNQSNVSIPDSMLICFQEPVTLVATSNISDNQIFNWYPTEFVLDGNGTEEVKISLSYSRYVYVSATDESGCKAIDSCYIRVQTNTFEEGLDAWANKYVMFYGDTVFLHATNYSLNEYQYEWTPSQDLATPHSQNTKAFPNETTVFTVNVTDVFGCTKSDTVRITVFPTPCEEPFIFVPNAFTPNGDVLNDILYVRGDYISSMNFRIYNQWGEKVFETNNLTQGWDGTYKGNNAPQGVYDYYLNYICSGHSYQKKGNITLIR